MYWQWFYDYVVLNIFGQNSSWFWAMLQTIIVGVSLLFIYRQVKLQSDANMFNSLRDHIERWNSDHMKDARIIVCQEFLAGNKHIENVEVYLVLNFYEELGLYHRNKIFSTDAVWNMFAYHIETYWNLLEPTVREYRAISNDTSFFKDFEKMKLEFGKYSKSQNIPLSPETDRFMRKFAKGEIKTLNHFLLKKQQLADRSALELLLQEPEPEKDVS